MFDPRDLSEEEQDLRQLRMGAAERYRAEGFPDYAEKVSAGEVDHCRGMMMERFLPSRSVVFV
jgi:hypothetical protein